MPPPHFEIGCPKCGEVEKLTWSEFEGHLWCYKCEEDLPCSTHDIYPIALAVALGMNFNRVIIGKGIDRYNVKEDKYESEIK